jgi:hypothetical protein
MKVLVCGGREYDDWSSVKEVLDDYHSRYGITLVIQGGARGADFLGRVWAVEHDIEFKEFPADWKTNGRRAGPIRNALMLNEGNPDLVVAFSGGRGTKDMLDKATNKGVKVYIHE